MRRIFSVLIPLVALAAANAALAGGHESSSARSGAEVFETNCSNCHSGGFTGLMTGAPDIDDADDWENLAPKGADELTANTINGIGDMAPRGGCVECTDEEIRAAVEHILEKVQ